MEANENGQQRPIVIDELLCFISNKASSIAYQLLVKLCYDTFTDLNVVTKSKDVIFGVMTDTNLIDDARKPRKVKHRGEDRRLLDIKDIVNVFLQLPPAIIPRFVAEDLSVLPPLSMDCFDISRVVKDIENIKSQMQLLQEAQQTSLTVHAAICDGHQHRRADSRSPVRVSPSRDSSARDSPVRVSPVRNSPTRDRSLVRDSLARELPAGDSLARELHAGDSLARDSPTRVSNESLLTGNHVVNPGSDVETDTESEEESEVDQLLRLARLQGLHHPQRGANKQNRRPRYKNFAIPESSLVHDAGPRNSQRHDPKDDHNLVIHGSAKNTDLETVPARKNTGPVTCMGVFVSRLSTSVKATQVRKYIKRHTGLSVKIERLKTKYNNYSSFFIPVTEPDRSKLLNPEVWPTQCIVKKYCRYN